MISKKMALCVVLIYPSLVHSQAGPGVQRVVDCAQATKTRPHVGVAYTGRVTNEDFGLSLRVPSGLTAWGGVAPDAPFHGFTFFLDSATNSCIVVEVHLRVDEEDTPSRPPGSPRLQFGGAEGWQITERGTVHGVSITNVRTEFTFTRPSRTDDGEILLVSPTLKLSGAKRIYDDFLRSLSFSR